MDTDNWGTGMRLQYAHYREVVKGSNEIITA